MSDILKEIINVLSEYEDGLKASKIANILGVARSTINSNLYSNRDKFILNKKSYIRKIKNKRQTLTKAIKKETDVEKSISVFDDHVLNKLNNKDKAYRNFTENDFNSLANRKVCIGHSETKQKTYITKNLNKIYCDSSSEIKMIKKLDENEVIKIIGGQNIEIPYKSYFASHKKYYPDIWFLSEDGYIGIIEVKPLTSMSHHLNLDKYHALKDYCINNGYVYMMIDPDSYFQTYDDLINMKIDDFLFRKFIQFEYEYKTQNKIIEIDSTLVNNLFKEVCPDCTKKDFDLMVHSLLIKFKYYNKSQYGFNAQKEPF